MNITTFLGDFVTRLLSQSPKFFNVIKVIAIICALLTGLPDFLMSHGIDIPDAWDAIASKTVSIASWVAAFIAQLTVKDTNQQVTKN